MVFPSRRIVIRLQSALTSFNLWEIKMIVWPFSLKSFNCSNNSSVSCGVSTLSARPGSEYGHPGRVPLRSQVSDAWQEKCPRPFLRLYLQIVFFGKLRSDPHRLFPVYFNAVPVSAPRIRFSATVMDGTCMKCWCTMPSPAAIASLDDEKCTSFPSTKIWLLSVPACQTASSLR